ncbi:MAG TPA: acetyl-CoA C-acyltransferase, partial [Thermomicrobiales bacterium]|nr:acetyl-CoA C-acyltransferase [Thermomicrobiales bacterium]
MTDFQPASVILGGARTPFGRLNGALAGKSAVELGAIALRAAIERAGVGASDIEDVIMGQVLQGGAGQNPARQAAFAAGLDRTVPAETINRVCGSGLRAVTLADSLIRAGDYDVIATGGMESMTNAPYIIRQARAGYRFGNGVLEDLAQSDGLTCAIDGCAMGLHGGAVAAEEGVSREEQDAWALRSHRRALAARDEGRLAEEIVPVEITSKAGTTLVEHDEAPRRDTSAEALARLKPAFDPSHTVTAGNAPGLNDGAAALILADAAWAESRGLTPLA